MILTKNCIPLARGVPVHGATDINHKSELSDGSILIKCMSMVGLRVAFVLDGMRLVYLYKWFDLNT